MCCPSLHTGARVTAWSHDPFQKQRGMTATGPTRSANLAQNHLSLAVSLTVGETEAQTEKVCAAQHHGLGLALRADQALPHRGGPTSSSPTRPELRGEEGPGRRLGAERQGWFGKCPRGGDWLQTWLWA